MKLIKFSHNYDKLHGQKLAKLVDVEETVGYEAYLHPDFVEADTRYQNADGSIGHFELPDGVPLLILTFIGDKRIPFTTIRRWNTEKTHEYKTAIGEYFEVFILPEPKQMRGKDS